MLTSPQESAKRRLKKLSAMNAMPSIRDGVAQDAKDGLCDCRAACGVRRGRRLVSWRGPGRQSPVVEVTTIRKTPSHA